MVFVLDYMRLFSSVSIQANFDLVELQSLLVWRRRLLGFGSASLVDPESLCLPSLSHIKRVGRDLLSVSGQLWLTVVTVLISRRSQHGGVSLLLDYKLLSLLTASFFLLFIFDLWRLWLFPVQTGVSLTGWELLIRGNYLFHTDMGHAAGTMNNSNKIPWVQLKKIK